MSDDWRGGWGMFAVTCFAALWFVVFVSPLLLIIEGPKGVAWLVRYVCDDLADHCQALRPARQRSKGRGGRP